MNSNKEKYEIWCEGNNSIPLFYRYAYYQTLFGDNWDVILDCRGENIVGVMPFVLRSKFGFKKINPELLFPYQGIWINYPDNQKNATKISFEKEVITNIINQLPKVAFFNQQFHPSFTNWLPLYWKDYRQTTRYTYIIKDISNLDVVFNDFKDKTRNSIKKAEQHFSVTKSTSIDDFIAFKSETNNLNPLNLTGLKRVINFALEHHSGEILVAKNNDGIVCSSIFYMWDELSAYLLQSINNKKINYSGASSLLIWEAIKNASSKTKSFDFEGGIIETVESFFRGFGGIQTPYFDISKTNSSLLKALNYSVKK